MSLYVWQEYGADERWGTIAAIVPAISPAPVPLVLYARQARETPPGPMRDALIARAAAATRGELS